MAHKDQSIDPILEDWVQHLRSDHPERMARLYHAQATVTYGTVLLQGREELEDVLRLQRRKLMRFGVMDIQVAGTTPQSLCFHLRLLGPAGWILVRNEWHVRDGLIIDHFMQITARQILPTKPSSLAA